MRTVWTSDTSSSVDHNTLILSVPGFGNVGQLALDVLIASSKATLAARVDCGDDVVALVCPDPYQEDSSEPHTAVELYHASDAPVSLLQIRAGIKKGRTKVFADNLGEWILAEGFQRAILLVGGDVAWAKEESLLQARVCCMGGDSVKAVLEQVAEASGAHPVDVDGELVTHMFGSRSPAVQVTRAAARLEIPLVTLAGLCHEGDNTPDGLQLAARCVGVLHRGALTGSSIAVVPIEANRINLCVPPSWDMMYGPPTDPGLFN